MLLLSIGCAGYQVGNWSLYPSHIETVSVSIFQTSSFRRDLGERLTEAVMKEIERTTPFKVVSAENADSTLTGQIVSDNKAVQFRDPTNGPRKIEHSLSVRVTWVDKRGKILRDCPPVPIEPECIAVTGQSELVPEFGQSTATATQQAIDRVARQIVGLMEAPW
jgi:hypothetical protein